MRYLDWYHSKKSRKQIFLFIYISFILDISGYSLLVPLVTYVVEKHSGGSFEIGLCFSGYALCQLISSAIFGRLSDRYGRRPMLLTCILGQLVGTLVQVLAPNIWIYVIARMLTGLFDDCFALCQACIADMTTLSERAVYLAQVDAVYSCGFLIGPVIGGFLSAYSLDAAQYLAAAFFLLSGLFAYFTINETMKTAVEMNQLRHQLRKAKQQNSLIDIDLIQQKMNNLSMIMTSKKPKGKVRYNKFIIVSVVEEFCNKWVLSCNDTIFGVFGSLKFGMDSLTLSLCNAGEGLTNVIQQGYLFDYFLNKLNLSITLILIIGGICDFVAVFVVAFAPNLTIAIIGIFIMIAGYGFASPGAPSIVSTESPPDSQGEALAVVQLGGQLALCIGPLVLGYIYEFLPELPFYVSSFFGLMLILCMVYLRSLPGGKYAGVIPSSEYLLSANNKDAKADKTFELSKLSTAEDNDDDTALASTPVGPPADSVQVNLPTTFDLVNDDGLESSLLSGTYI